MSLAVAAVAAVMSGCSSATVTTPHPSPLPASAHPPLSPTHAPSYLNPTPPPSPYPSLPVGPVPGAFNPESVTFVSLTTGFVLGSAPCAPYVCLALLKTGDAGASWHSLPVPAAAASWPPPGENGPGVSEVRFANPEDGWLFGPDLWSTHDGGQTWTRQGLPGGSQSTVASLEADASAVHAAVFDVGDVSPGVVIITSPLHSDSWRASATRTQFGAGPIPQAQLVLQGTAGWMLENDRTPVGGARLVAGAWLPWQPPCFNNGGFVSLAAATSHDMVAVCREGDWCCVNPPAVHMYFSHDGGLDFTRSAAVLSEQQYYVFTTPVPGVVFTNYGTSGGLYETLDYGRTWFRVNTAGFNGTPEYIGFTSPQQGVALVDAGALQVALLMTFDAGRDWQHIVFH